MGDLSVLDSRDDDDGNLDVLSGRRDARHIQLMDVAWVKVIMSSSTN
jgi:hypothetical protein